MTTNADTPAALVGAFGRGWARPHRHAWDDLLADDVALSGSLMADGRGRAAWHDELARMLALVPDLRGEVTHWAARDDVVFVELRLTGSVAGRALRFAGIDRMTLGQDGRIVARHTTIDATALVTTLLRRPRAWGPWWRSGLGPFVGRRRLLPAPGPT